MQAALEPPRNLRDVDEQAFGALAEPHRRELTAHCYRMTGSILEAEDLTQETMARAWRRRETYEGRAPLRAWLYKIATNLCLDALRQRPRRTLPVARGAAGNVDEPVPPPISEPIWLEPFPDDLLAPEADEPEARFSRRESVTLAFMTSLHLLPPRQRAVLILRDVLDWQAAEVAELLDQSVPAVKSALHRARTTLAQHYQSQPARHLSPTALDERLRPLLEEYVQAWETADVDRLLALLKADASFSMPPIPAWYQGREAVGRLVSATVFSGPAAGRWRMQHLRASGQPAVGLYRLDGDTGQHHAYGVQVITFDGDQIADLTACLNPALAPFFGMPAVWPR